MVFFRRSHAWDDGGEAHQTVDAGDGIADALAGSSARRVGGRSATLEIRQRGGNLLTVALVGSGTSRVNTASMAEASPTRLAFGEQPVRTSSARMTVLVRNRGRKPLSIQQAWLPGGDAHDFVVEPTCSGASVPPERSGSSSPAEL
jgi:hypothetical protein